MQKPLRSVFASSAAVMAGLIVLASPALAQGSPAAAPAGSALPIRACNLAVCETLLALPPPQLRVAATATPAGPRCDRFEMSVGEPVGSTQVFTSPFICSARPAYTFDVTELRPLPPGTTIAMRFISNPPTPGMPVIRLF